MCEAELCKTSRCSTSTIWILSSLHQIPIWWTRDLLFGSPNPLWFDQLLFDEAFPDNFAGCLVVQIVDVIYSILTFTSYNPIHPIFLAPVEGCSLRFQHWGPSGPAKKNLGNLCWEFVSGTIDLGKFLLGEFFLEIFF